MTLVNKRTLNYRITDVCPTIPINFFFKDGTPTQTYNDAVLDSGAYGIAIPLSIAVELELEITMQDHPGQTAGGPVDTWWASADFRIGRAKVCVEYKDVDICVLDCETRILVGMKPVFNDFIVTIDGRDKKVSLVPK
jgi:hypothetical protein